MARSNIGNKVWQVAGVLQTAGLSYSDYLEQITFLLFLKMVHENSALPEKFKWKGVELPTDCTWDTIVDRQGDDLTSHYSEILTKLACQPGMIGKIYCDAQNKISQAVHLRKVVDMIKDVHWSSLSEDVKGDIYEDLLERIAQDSKSGAGQYFTPRAVIKTIVKCVNPQPGKTVADPCCGSGGFLLAAKAYMEQQKQLDEEQAKVLKWHTFSGTEIVSSTYRLCLMNLLLHGIGEFGGDPPIKRGDSLASQPKGEDLRDYVLTNPPFGTKLSSKVEALTKDKKTGEKVVKTKAGGDSYTTRSDFIATTSNKQLSFLQHVKSMLAIGGTAAVVLPDNILYEGDSFKKVRNKLLEECDLHTILRLPSGIFYKQGIKTNVLFFERTPPSNTRATKEVWIYDYRTNVKYTLVENPLTEKDLEDFVRCYNPKNRHERKETYNHDANNPQGRWRRFSIEEILQRDNISLDITWLKQDKDESDDQPLSVLLDTVKEEGNSLISTIADLYRLMEGVSEE